MNRENFVYWGSIVAIVLLVLFFAAQQVLKTLAYAKIAFTP